MGGGLVDDPLADLKRRAYGRPDDPDDAAAAQAALAALAEPPAEHVDADPHPAAPTTARRRTLAGIAAGVVASLVLALAVTLSPRPSLEVFDRPQLGVPEWPGARSEDDAIRWLGSRAGWDVFGFITGGGNVCLTGFRAGQSAGGACTSREQFTIRGLELEIDRGSGTEFLVARWGPLGDARLVVDVR